MTNRDERWLRVGDALTERMRVLALSKAEVIARSGVSFKTLVGYLAGEPIKRVDKARELSRALNWPDNAIELILDGQDPRLIDIEGPSNDLTETVLRLDAELTALRKEFNELRAAQDASLAPGPETR